jgi:hypothetical protein
MILRDATVVNYFLGTASRFADAATLDAVQEIVSSHAPDPVALRQINWELALFYRLADWKTSRSSMRASTTAP